MGRGILLWLLSVSRCPSSCCSPCFGVEHGCRLGALRLAEDRFAAQLSGEEHSLRRR